MDTETERREGDFGRSKIKFNTLVQNAIDQVLQSTDPLDSNDFHCVDYINQLFPNEQSLSNIDEVVSKMECEISLIDDNIRGVVRGQTNTGQDGRLALQEAQKVIKDLYSQISEIKTRAEKTEEMVKEITRDIKQLDCAKRNLTTAITALNHLHMFVGGVESLTDLIEKRLYGEILNPLQAIAEVNHHFQQFYDIPQIKDLSKKMHEIHLKLANQITEDFHNTFSSKTSVQKMSTAQLTEACKVASVLEPKVKKDLLKWFLNLQLEEYVQLFHENQDIAWLDKIDKRYAWLKRQLLDFEEKFGHVFPDDWEVSERMAVQFCIITREELLKIMKKRRSEIDVKLLLFAISKTQNFEQLLSKRFTGLTLDSKNIGFYTISSDATTIGSTGFINLIGSCFEPYLDIYTESVDRNLTELIDRFVQLHKQSLNTSEVRPTVFPSCADLFVFYKKCILQCNQLSNSKALYDMAMLFKKYLREYAAKVLEISLPKITASHTSIGTSMSLLTKDLQNLSTAAGQVFHNLLKEGETQRFNSDELVQICCVLTTAEYCLETIHQLEAKLKEKVEPCFVDKIDLSEEKDIYHRIISNCIQLLVQDLENGCESALNVMSRMQWQLIGYVGDQSAFVNSLISNFKHTIPIIRDNLSTSRKYYTQFCHKFVSSFIPKYINTLLKCRPNSSADGSSSILGCEQLLLDTHSLKTVLLDLPSISSNVNRKAPTSYTKAVIKGMTRAEMIIKIVMTPVAPAMTFNEQIFKLLPDITLSEYQKILEMKGVKKADQIQLIELFKKASQANEANSNSSFFSNELHENTQSDKIAKLSISSSNSPESSTDRRRIRKLENLIKQRLPN